MKKSLYIKSTFSTNDVLKELVQENDYPEGFCVYTDFQTAGKGQQGNKWNAEKGKNLLFSLVVYPAHVSISGQFILSQIISLAIKKALGKYTDDVKIKWPNDIYWKDKKLGGILIENSLQGNFIKYSVIGIGLNINQMKFSEEIPNPVSLKQITGKTHRRKTALKAIREHFTTLYYQTSYENIKADYLQNLYRKEGFHRYRDEENTVFEAKIIDVRTDGKLLLQTKEGKIFSFYFKEVVFLP